MRFFLTLALGLVVFSGIALAVTDHENVDWGYSGAGAAKHWGDLNEKYSVCKTGQKQSPVNIAKYIQQDMPVLNMAYQDSSLKVVNNGNTVLVKFDEGSSFESSGKTYFLHGGDFHTPSEHYLDGAPYPMELHLFHKDANGDVAVLAVMMKVEEHHPVIEGIWQNVPAAKEMKAVESVQINASDLLPESLDYYRYNGSLTSPPCSEIVEWFILKEPIGISGAQLRAFQDVFSMNARPIQPLSGRVIRGN